MEFSWGIFFLIIVICIQIILLFCLCTGRITIFTFIDPSRTINNNTRNNTHIANVGLAMASNEERAYEVMMSLDVDYALVVFGGKIGYSSDDINKFLWMVRISGGIYPGTWSGSLPCTPINNE